jgi:hypothetical protein
MTRSYAALRVRVARRALLQLTREGAPTIALLLAAEALRLAAADAAALERIATV